MEHTSEMMNDTLDDALDNEETEGEGEDVVNQVCLCTLCVMQVELKPILLKMSAPLQLS